jgi:hypothetical protein
MVPKIGILVAEPFVFQARDRYVRKLFAMLEIMIGSAYLSPKASAQEGIAEQDGRTENTFSL